MSEVLATWLYTAKAGGAEYGATCTNPYTCTKAIVPDTYNGIPVTDFDVNCSSSDWPYVDIILGNNILQINTALFQNAKRSFSLECGSGLTSIGYNAFYNSKLKNLTLCANEVLTINATAFDSCYSTELLSFKEGITELIAKSQAFRYFNTPNLVLPNSLTTITCSSGSGSPFESNNYILSITIPSGMTNIPASVFNWCQNLKTIYMGALVTSIGANAFSRCDSLTDIYFTGTQEQWSAITVGSNNYKFTSATVHLVRNLAYNTNGGTLESGFPNPDTLSDFPNPMPTVTLGNYSFGGWYLDNNTFANQITAGSAISDNMTIYAKLLNSITYNLDGGSNNAKNNAYYTSIDQAQGKLLYAPSKTGYDFEGWYTDSSFTTKVLTCSSFDGNPVTLYAKFTSQESYDYTIKTESGKKKINLDAYTVRGKGAYTNINISTLTTMGLLYAQVNEINSRNEHVFYDLSTYISGAYVCLVDMKEVGTTYYCEIHDLLNNVIYYKSEGFSPQSTIQAYIQACTKKDSYENILVSSLSTMGELRSFVEDVNTRGDHCFFDFSSYVTGAYVCTVQIYTLSTINYCFIFDLLNGKLYGNYLGYSDSDSIATYCSSNTGDVTHTVKITDANITLADVITLINKVGAVQHHAFFDASLVLNGSSILSIVYSTPTSSSTGFAMLSLAGGTYKNSTISNTSLATTTLASFLYDKSVIATSRDLLKYRTASAQDAIDATKLSDAPSDNKQYARKNGAWSEVESGSSEGAVRYDEAQSLTDTLKTLARTNIGAIGTTDSSSTNPLPVIADNLTGVSTATVGQVIKVASVDGSGNVTSWTTADGPSQKYHHYITAYSSSYGVLFFDFVNDVSTAYTTMQAALNGVIGAFGNSKIISISGYQGTFPPTGSTSNVDRVYTTMQTITGSTSVTLGYWYYYNGIKSESAQIGIENWSIYSDNIVIL